MAKTQKVNLGKKGSFTEHPGKLHRALGIPEGEKIPMAKKEAAAHSSNPTMAKMGRSALGFAAMKHKKG